ncbi:MAG TPA: hypothetical protein PK990_07190 [Salinivirgaceae bacterium]|nr:hypothetical protein [Salinivirgaceae bacterium]
MRSEKNYTLLSISLLVAFLIGCSGKKATDSLSGVGAESADSLVKYRTDAIKEIFYNIPSPLEMASLIEKSKVSYNPQLLSRYGREKEFLTQDFQALNLGVYGADLSYCRVFDQIQESIKYLSSIRNLTMALQIPDDESSVAVERLEKNLANKDSLINVSIALFSEADLYLKENNREGTAVLILLGSWVEGMYLATQLVADQSKTSALMEKIASQKLANQHLLNLYEPFHKENPIRTEIFDRLKRLSDIYQKVTMETTQTNAKTQPEQNKTVLTAEYRYTIDKETFEKLKNELAAFRAFIIKQ